MNKLKLRIITYLGVAIAICAIFIAVPGYKMEVTPLGSVLSTYFYNKHTNTDNLYPTYKQHLANITDYKLKKFYKKLEWEHKSTQVDFISDIDATWQLYNTQGQVKNNYLLYWQTIRPEIKNFYATNIAPVKISTPVVHFRCSDAPFVLHPLYHLTKASTVQWMIEKIKDRGYTEVTMLSCNKHRKVKNNPCAKYLKFYTALFVEAGVKVKTQCHDVYTDFAMMVYSPLLISLNESSYSFMAGISKDPNDYISCNLGREYAGRYLLQDQADWHMSTEKPVLHTEVQNYKEADAVLAKLH